jgi:hypothetical protein
LYNNYQKAVDGIKKPTIKTLQVNFKDSRGGQALELGGFTAAFSYSRISPSIPEKPSADLKEGQRRSSRVRPIR